MLPYFNLTNYDRKFYSHHIAPRIPKRIFDIHVHMNLEEHIKLVPEERWLSDWALECGHLLPIEDAFACAQELFPDSRYLIAGFPWPIKESDLKNNNEYLSAYTKRKKLYSFMTVRPEWNVDYIEQTLLEGSFIGFKPYPDMISGIKGADISIFNFFPHAQWKILDKYARAVMLHLPRKERFASDDNIKELLEAKQKYPNVTIIIAHFGRSFCPSYLDKGLTKIGDATGFYFDTSAVINPAVYDIAFTRIDSKSILFGTDMPISFWRGKREWTENTYINLSSEDYSWNKIRKSPEEEAEYTIFLYEEVKTILDAVDKHGFGKNEKNDLFFNNSIKALRINCQ